jgi:hypothetical protein
MDLIKIANKDTSSNKNNGLLLPYFQEKISNFTRATQKA